MKIPIRQWTSLVLGKLLCPLESAELRQADPSRYDMLFKLATADFRMRDTDSLRRDGTLPQDFVPGQDFEETYLLSRRLDQRTEVLPYKKVASFYVFQKKP